MENEQVDYIEIDTAGKGWNKGLPEAEVKLAKDIANQSLEMNRKTVPFCQRCAKIEFEEKMGARLKVYQDKYRDDIGVKMSVEEAKKLNDVSIDLKKYVGWDKFKADSESVNVTEFDEKHDFAWNENVHYNRNGKTETEYHVLLRCKRCNAKIRMSMGVIERGGLSPEEFYSKFMSTKKGKVVED